MVGQKGQRDFASLLKMAISSLQQDGALGAAGRPQAAFSAKCNISPKTLRRWLGGERPQADKWEGAKSVLTGLGIEAALIDEMDQLWKCFANARSAEKGEFGERGVDSHSFEVHPWSPFPKLCSIVVEIPEQGSLFTDFILVGEVRFSRAPDLVDNTPIIVGIKRAVLLPLPKNCYIKPGSLHRQTFGSHAQEGAEQTIYKAEGGPEAVLEGDQLKGETLARFISLTDEPDGELPSVDMYVQIENASDLQVDFVELPRGRSTAQRKLAEHWIKHQFGNIVREQDGTWRLASCKVKWKAAR